MLLRVLPNANSGREDAMVFTSTPILGGLRICRRNARHLAVVTTGEIRTREPQHRSAGAAPISSGARPKPGAFWNRELDGSLVGLQLRNHYSRTSRSSIRNVECLADIFADESGWLDVLCGQP